MIIQYKLQYASLVAYISLQMVQSTHHDATDSELVLDSPTFHWVITSLTQATPDVT